MSRFVATILFLSLCASPLALRAQESGNAAQIREDEIIVDSAEGIHLHALLIRPTVATGKPTAVLLHALGRDRDALLPLADALVAAGYPALAIDLRGHGSSSRVGKFQRYSFKVAPPTDLHKAVDDLQRVINKAHEATRLDIAQLIIVGVGQGALVAAEASARKPAFKAMVIVDPPHNYAGFHLEQELGYFGGRPVLFICSAMASSYDRALVLRDFGYGEREIRRLESYDTQDHLLAAGTNGIEEITTWLEGHFSAD